MAFRYSFELNGRPLQDVSIGAVVIDKLEEPLDEGTLRLPFSMQNYEYPMFGYLKIKVKDYDDILDNNVVSFEYLIISDEVSEGSKYGEFIHELTLIEYTHKYDKRLVNTLSLTKVKKDKTPAPFLYHETAVISTTNTSYIMYAWLPPLKVDTTYLENDIIFKAHGKGTQAKSYKSGTTNLYTYGEISTYVKINGTKKWLDTEDASFELEVGDYEVEYGFHSIEVGDFQYTPPFLEDQDVPVYTYYIRVIPKEVISIYDILDMIRDNISTFGGIESKKYFDQTRMFNIDPTIVDYLKGVEIPQTFIQRATLRQVLNSVFLYVNSISRLYRDRDENMDILSMDKFNKIVGDFHMGDVTSFHTSQDAQELSSKGVGWLERVLPDNREHANIIEPSGDMFKTVRSNAVQILQDKQGIELSRPIYEPIKFHTFLNDLKVYSGDITLGKAQSKTYNNYEIDLMPRFLNKQDWEIKLATTNYPSMAHHGIFATYVGTRNLKVVNLHWEQNSTFINFGDVFGVLWQESLIKNVIGEALAEQITRNMPKPHVYTTIETSLNEDVIAVDYSFSVSGLSNTGTLLTDPSTKVENLGWRFLRFNLEYITQENVTVEVERDDMTYLDYFSEARINQSDKLLNVESASRKMYGDMQRSGVPSKTFQKYHTTVGSIYPVGVQDTNGFVITTRKLELQNNYILATYNVTKDHNRLSQFIGIEQAYRVFEIPTTSQVYERIEPYSDIVYITAPHRSVNEQTTKIYTSGAYNHVMKLLLGNLINDFDNGKTRVTNAYIRTDTFLDRHPDSTYKYAISTPVNAFGYKGGLVFQFGFKNNQIALNAVEYTDTPKDYDKRFNKAIKYTDDLGNMNELWFQLTVNGELAGNETDWSEAEKLDNYPLIKTNHTSIIGNAHTLFMSGNLDREHPDYDPLIITKDKSQSIMIPYHLKVLTDNFKEYIIGQDFFVKNLLVRNPEKEHDLEGYQDTIIGTTKYLYLYNTVTKYNKFDDLKIKDGWAKKIELVPDVNALINPATKSFYFVGNDILNMSGTVKYANWAIGDDLGNLYLACNTNYNGFKFYKRHYRYDMIEIGDLRDNRDIALFDLKMVAGLDLDYHVEHGRPIEIDGSLITSLDLDYHVEHGRPLVIDGDLEVALDLDYWRTKDIGADLDSEMIVGLNLNYVKVAGLPMNLNSEMIAELDLNYWRTHDVGAEIDGNMIADLDLQYVKTAGIPMTINSNLIADLNLEYWRTHDVGFNLSESMIASLDLDYVKSAGKPMTLNGNLDIDLDFDYWRTKDIGENLNGNMIMGISLNYRKSKDIGATLNGGMELGLSFDYSAKQYKWTSGGSSPVGTNQCLTSADVGNTRCDQMPSTCTWNIIDSYISFSDESQNTSASCMLDGVQKTECVQVGQTWACNVSRSRITGYTYSNCEICSIV